MELEHDLRSTISAMRLADRLDLDRQTRADTYYATMLMYVGCTADVHVRAEFFDDIETAARALFPAFQGPQRKLLGALLRAVAPERPALSPVMETARQVPRVFRHMPAIDVACREVAGMLSDRLGLPASVRDLAATIDERWDGKGEPGLLSCDALPVAVRIAHVARDADLQRSLGGVAHACRVIGEHAGAGLDPGIAGLVRAEANDMLACDDGVSAWDEALARHPRWFLRVARSSRRSRR